MNSAEQREEALFEAALQLPADQRAAYLDQACAGDPETRRRVEVLLGAFERAGGFMKQPATPERTLRSSLPPTEKPGAKIGRYKLLEQIGEGGCGVVYVAEQEEPVRRRVALKVIKLGMDTKQVIARFDAERQALAMMDHPNIAKIHDAGVTDTGRPYFVMELVRGIKITDYCDQHHLPPRERLDLFIQVCRAIQHAHQKGVIHRDIKPSNILVTMHDGVPVPKVIDFGIAKATQGRLTDQTVYTAFEQFIGTPAYMSPEQAELSGLDIDTRSDIYSLGVLLYELLTGTTPFDAKKLLGAGLDEMRRTIREVEPVKPSTRLTQELVAADVSPLKSHGSTEGKVRADSRRLLQEVRGDLDWIVMKCLEKDRTRRYETANGLATDLSRHLSNEPVVARPPSRLYRFQKTVQRNKLAFAAAAAAALALVIGLTVSMAMYFRGQAEKKKAQTEAVRSGQVAQLLKEMLKSAGPSVALGRDVTVLREMLEKTSDRVRKKLKDQPEVQGDIYSTIGDTFLDMGDHRRAITNYEQAVASYRLVFPGDHPNLAYALCALGFCQSFTEDLAHGTNNTRLGLEMARRCGDEQILFTCLWRRAISLGSWGMGSAESGPYLREALELKRRMGNDPVGLAMAMQLYASSTTNTAEAEQLVRGGLELYRKNLPAGDPKTIQGIFNLGQYLIDCGKFEEAEPLMAEALEGFHQTHSPNHPYQHFVLRFYLEALLGQGKDEQAAAVVRERLDGSPTNPSYLDLSSRVARLRASWPSDPAIRRELRGDFLWTEPKLLDQTRSPEELEKLWRGVLKRREETLGYGAGETVNARFSLASVLVREGKQADADALYREMAETNPDAAGHFYGRAGLWKEAAAAFAQKIEAHPDQFENYRLLAPIFLFNGDVEGYRTVCRQIITRFTRDLDATAADRLAKACLIHPDSQIDLKVAADWADTAVTSGNRSENLPWFQLCKALAEYRQEHWVSAVEWAQKALGKPDQLERNACAYLVLAMTQAKLKQSDAARTAFSKATELVEEKLPRLDGGDLGNWVDVLHAHILMREAEALLEGQTNAPPAKMPAPR